MNYNNLIQDINTDVNTNGHHAITGAKLNNVLNEMVTVLGAGFRIAGEVQPDSAEQEVGNGLCYIARESGTYANFGNVEVRDNEFAILYYQDGEWQKMGWERKDFGLVVVDKPTLSSFGADEMKEVKKYVSFIVREDPFGVEYRLFVRDRYDAMGRKYWFYAAPMLSADEDGDLVLSQCFIELSDVPDQGGRCQYDVDYHEFWLASKDNIIGALSTKQDVLTFDTTPTAGSTNPVTSGGIKAAIDGVPAVPSGGTTGQVLTKTSGGYGWQDSQGGGVTDVTVGGTSVVSGGVAVVPAIPDITDCIQKSQTAGLVKNDGTIDTTQYGTYSKPSGGIPASDLATAVQTSLGKADTALQSYTETDPVFSASPAAGITSSDISEWDGKAEPTAVVDASTIPASMEPNTVYRYGTLSGNTTFPAFATPASNAVANVWCWTFTTPSTAPTITWPAGITEWAGGSAPTINASKSYEVSVMDGLALIVES